MIKFDVMGHGVMFECSARDTRNGFAHDATMIIDGRRIVSTTAYYLNRTWEHWRFQSACLSCVSDLIQSRVDELRDFYRREHELSRICGPKRKQEVDEIVKCDDQIMFFCEIKRILREECF